MDLSTVSLFYVKVGACCALGVWCAVEFLRVEQTDRSVWEVSFSVICFNLQVHVMADMDDLFPYLGPSVLSAYWDRGLHFVIVDVGSQRLCLARAQN
jgi:hypothetical protein